MKPTLITFGDSWTNGSDLEDKNQKYGCVLAELLGYDYEDFSRYSTGVPHLLIQFRNFVNQHQLWPHPDSSDRYCAVFFLSARERGICFDDQHMPLEMIPTNENFENYFAEVYTDDLGVFNLNNTLLSLQSLCKLYGIQDYYMFGWQTCDLWPEIDRSRFYDRGRSNILNLFAGDRHSNLYDLTNNPNPYMIFRNGHPNVQGHQLIADVIAELIRKNTP